MERERQTADESDAGCILLKSCRFSRVGILMVVLRLRGCRASSISAAFRLWRMVLPAGCRRCAVSLPDNVLRIVARGADKENRAAA